MRMQGYCDVYKWIILKPTSPEVKCLHPTSSRRKMCTSSVSNVIYHKFSHGAAFYTLNGKNVNVMLEYCIKSCQNPYSRALTSEKPCINKEFHVPLMHRYLTFHMQDSGQYSINKEEASRLQLKLSIKRFT